MIAPLRRRHRWMTGGLAIALPVLYVVALSARPDEPITLELPSTLAEAGTAGGQSPGQLDNDLGELFTDPPIAVKSRSDGASWWVELEPRTAVALPEVLVYWSRSSATGRLPDDAYLIGGMAGDRTRVFELPADALGHAGTLVLYSLGHQEVVASTRLPAFGWAEQTPAAEEAEATPAEDARAGEEAGS